MCCSVRGACLSQVLAGMSDGVSDLPWWGGGGSPHAVRHWSVRVTLGKALNTAHSSGFILHNEGLVSVFEAGLLKYLAICVYVCACARACVLKGREKCVGSRNLHNVHNERH